MNLLQSYKGIILYKNDKATYTVTYPDENGYKIEYTYKDRNRAEVKFRRRVADIKLKNQLEFFEQ